MLSSFASFLPSVLHINPHNDLPQPTVNPDEPQSDDDDVRQADVEPSQRDDHVQPPMKVKERDGKGPSEVSLFCVFRGF